MAAHQARRWSAIWSAPQLFTSRPKRSSSSSHRNSLTRAPSVPAVNLEISGPMRQEVLRAHTGGAPDLLCHRRRRGIRHRGGGGTIGWHCLDSRCSTGVAVDLLPVIMGNRHSFFGQLSLEDIRSAISRSAYRADRVTHLLFPCCAKGCTGLPLLCSPGGTASERPAGAPKMRHLHAAVHRPSTLSTVSGERPVRLAMSPVIRSHRCWRIEANMEEKA